MGHEQSADYIEWLEKRCKTLKARLDELEQQPDADALKNKICTLIDEESARWETAGQGRESVG